MRKNNKGFTLIEVIAVIVILGIMSVVVVPSIFGMITQSRDELYIQDAKKLIAQAQYKMSSNSDSINKPGLGECILMSMKYLNSSDFQSPPNGGQYMDESSFVVVKSNEKGNYEYAVMIVEKTSTREYRGIQLSTEEELNKKNAHKSVVTFDDAQVKKVESENENEMVDIDFINSNLVQTDVSEKWLLEGDRIIDRYNYEYSEKIEIKDSYVPTFKPTVIAADSNNQKSLFVNLTVTASDSDDAISDLMVCYKVNKADAKSNYPEKGSSDCHSYGNKDSFSASIDLAKYGFSNTEKTMAYINVIVYDPAGNVSKRLVEYYVDKNEPPQINSFTVKSANDTGINLPSVNIKLDVTDDLDKVQDLKVCLKFDDNSSCRGNDYKSYNTYFKSGSYYYTFKNSSGNDITTPDGSKHKVYLTVMDTMDEYKSTSVTYEIYKNLKPEILSTSTLVPIPIVNGKNGYTVNLKIDVKDDLSINNKIKLKIGDISITYEQYLSNLKNGYYVYTFPNETYDGKSRDLNVVVSDEYGESVSKKFTLDNVYANKAPTVSINSISSSSMNCVGCDSSIGGDYDTLVSFSIVDDLVTQSNFAAEGFKVCISEKESDCSSSNKNTNKFSTYSGNSVTYQFSSSGNKYLSSDVRTLYVAVVDNFGAYAVDSKKYSIYSNQAPEVTGTFSINSDEMAHSYCSGKINNNGVCEASVISYEYNVPNVKIDVSQLSVNDDFGKVNGYFCYHFGSDSTNEQCFKIDDVESSFPTVNIYDFTFLDQNKKTISNLNGQKINARIKLEDNYGAVTYTDYVTYTLFKDKAPEIKKLSMKSLVVLGQNSNYNGNRVTFDFTVLDFNDTYTVCVTEKDSCADSDFVNASGSDGYSGNFSGLDTLYSYTVEYDGEKNGWSSDYKYDSDIDTNKKFNFFVKDSKGNITKYDGSLDYNVYRACKSENVIEKPKVPILDYYGNPVLDVNGNPMYEDDNDISPVYEDKVISAEACEGKCYHKYTKNGSDIFNNYTAKYSRLITYLDKVTSSVCRQAPGDITDKYCDNTNCFFVDDYNNTKYIGLHYYEDAESWQFVAESLVEKVYSEDELCTNALDHDELLFCSDDKRCKNSNYCTKQVDSMCSKQKEDYDNIALSCSYFKKYNPYPCKNGKTPEENGCLNAPLRACLSDEDPNDGNCLKTCEEGENPEDRMCTPYGPFDINNIYDIVKADPCSEGVDPGDGSTCEFEPKRPCLEGESSDDGTCIRQCGFLTDEEGNYILDEETEEKIPENPWVSNCTNTQPLSSDKIEEITNKCTSDITTTYNSCVSSYTNECNEKLNGESGFCSNDRKDESWKEVSCVGTEDTDDYIVRYCEDGFIDGKCITNSSKCTPCTKEQYNNNTCDSDLKKQNCKRTCYMKIDCSVTLTDVPKIFECSGSYKVYSAYAESNKIRLSYTGVNVCPEFYNYYDSKSKKTGKMLEYPFKDSTGKILNIEFNQDEQSDDQSIFDYRDN